MKTVWNKEAPLLILHYSSGDQIDPDWPSPKYLFAKYFIPMSQGQNSQGHQKKGKEFHLF